MKCTQSTKGGKVHILVRVCPATLRIMKDGEGSPGYGKWTPLCDKRHDIDSTFQLDEWFHPWKRVDGPATCKTCLRLENYVPKAKYDGSSCPHCDSSNISAVEQVQMDGPEGTQRVTCYACGKHWYDIVKLTGWMEA